MAKTTADDSNGERFAYSSGELQVLDPDTGEFVQAGTEAPEQETEDDLAAKAKKKPRVHVHIHKHGRRS